MKANVSAYLQSWSAELLSRADRVRHLIGDAHWLSDGHHKEELLREFLLHYLPPDLVTARGFVKNATSPEICSTEIDILISDLLVCPPFFHEGALQIVDAASVVAHIEVKTEFSKSTFSGSLTSSLDISAIVQRRRELDSVWSGIVFYSGKQQVETILQTIQDCITSSKLVDEANAGKMYLPKAIVIINQCVVFLALEGEQIQCRLFELENLSLPCALIDLFGHVRQSRGGKALGGLDDVIETSFSSTPVKRTFAIR
jgi:hypothetical protein